jgi:hypothetical protein
MEHAGGKMNLVKGIHHKPTLEDRLITFLQVTICTLILLIIALYAAYAWIAEDDARIAKLQQHLYDIALRHDPVPAAPPKPTDLAKPKVTYFQDSSQPKGK